jgi:hypothetical protein
MDFMAESENGVKVLKEVKAFLTFTMFFIIMGFVPFTPRAKT